MNDPAPHDPARNDPAPPPIVEAPSVASATGDVPHEERQWAMFAHLSAIAGALVTSGVGGWGTFIGPLIIWLVKRDTLPFVADQAKEALNFNITVAIVFVALAILAFVTLGIGLIIAIPGWLIVGIGWLVLTIIAAIKANAGERYRYPLTLRLVN